MPYKLRIYAATHAVGMMRMSLAYASVKVDDRILHTCKALGMSDGMALPTVVFAKRLRGLGLAWHSFTLEECQVNNVS